jgi:hypothetical protein
MSSGTSTPTVVAEIEAALRILRAEPGAVWEVRAPRMAGKGTVSGYYNDPAMCARHVAAQLDSKGNIYFTLNPIQPALLARAHNRLKNRAELTTADADVLRRQWLPFDFDPARPTGVSSSDAEHEAALACAATVADMLSTLGWSDLIRGDSGNGGHLLAPIDLPNDEPSKALVERVLKVIAHTLAQHADPTVPQVHLDTSVGNAGRIWKVYGTTAGKGDDAAALGRPHRRAHLLHVPDQLVVVTPAQLEMVADLFGAPEPQGRASQNGHAGAPPQGPGWVDDAGAYLCTHGIAIRSEHEASNAHKWVLASCVWNPDHTDHSAWVMQFTGGAIAAGCSHNSCQGKGWPDFRDAVEGSEWRQRRKPRSTSAGAASAEADEDRTEERGESSRRSSAADAVQPPWRPTVQSARALMDKDLPPVRWAVRNLIAEGVTILAAKPKRGKTVLMLNISWSVAAGVPALGQMETEQGDVLYLALEDNERRMQRRLRQMLPPGRSMPEGFDLVYQWLPLDRGGIEALGAWLDEHPTTRLIVVDTLEHVRPRRKTNASVYAEDYGAVSGLQRLAGERQVAIVVVTHLRKGAAADPFDEISGSTGLTGGVDNILVMRSVNNLTELARRGRDYVDDTPIALKGDPESLTWTWQGNAEDVLRSAERQAILDALRAAGLDGLTPKELAEQLGKSSNSIRFLLFRMKEEGLVHRLTNGRYVLPEFDKGDQGGAASAGDERGDGQPDPRKSHGRDRAVGGVRGVSRVSDVSAPAYLRVVIPGDDPGDNEGHIG